MESIGPAEPMEALVGLLKHQTTLTERWQQMLLDQSESTKYLQSINVDNAKMVREQVEVTQKLVEVSTPWSTHRGLHRHAPRECCKWVGWAGRCAY